jgi:hypothetical protein
MRRLGSCATEWFVVLALVVICTVLIAWDRVRRIVE